MLITDLRKKIMDVAKLQGYTQNTLAAKIGMTSTGLKYALTEQTMKLKDWHGLLEALGGVPRDGVYAYLFREPKTYSTASMAAENGSSYPAGSIDEMKAMIERLERVVKHFEEKNKDK